MSYKRFALFIINLHLWGLCLNYLPTVTYSIVNDHIKTHAVYKSHKHGRFFFTSLQHAELAKAHGPSTMTLVKTLECLNISSLRSIYNSTSHSARVRTLLEFLAMYPVCRRRAKNEASKIFTKLISDYAGSKNADGEKSDQDAVVDSAKGVTDVLEDL